MSESDLKFPREWLHIAADLMSKAADEFGNHGCNDYRLPEWMLATDRLALDAWVVKRNGSLDEEPSDDTYSSDWCLMAFFAETLREMAGPVPAIPPERANEKRDEEVRLAKMQLTRAERDAADAAARLAGVRAALARLEKGGDS